MRCRFDYTVGMSPNRKIATYCLLQAVAGLAWWLAMWLMPALRIWFWVPSTSSEVLAAFAAADIFMFVVASAVAAGLVWNTHRWSQSVLWITVGGIAYTACYCSAIAVISGGAWLGAVLMLLALCGTSIAAVCYRE